MSVGQQEAAEIREALWHLATRIDAEVAEELREGSLKPGKGAFRRWIVNDFDYGERGVQKYSASSDVVVKETWESACISMLHPVRRSEEYDRALRLLTACSEEKAISGALGRLAQYLIWIALTEHEAYEAKAKARIDAFGKELREETLEYRAEVSLGGVVVLSQAIDFTAGDTAVLLRPVRKADFEKEIRASFHDPFDPYPEHPSAILLLETPAASPDGVRKVIEETKAILRLFSVGSVDHITYEITSESVMTPSGSVGSRRQIALGALETYVVRESDAPALVEFWKPMSDGRVDRLNRVSEPAFAHLAIAYMHYCSALFSDGVVERRIASAVMGLESLFLRGAERHKLSQRLCRRLARLLGLCGENMERVRKVARSAYEVRSTFVHGSLLGDEERGELDEEHSGLRAFVRTILDLLRMSILAFLVAGEKEEFVGLIDTQAEGGGNKEKELRQLVAAAEPLLARR